MLEGDLKDHNIRLYLGMPKIKGGMLGENTLHGVLATIMDQGPRRWYEITNNG